MKTGRVEAGDDMPDRVVVRAVGVAPSSHEPPATASRAHRPSWVQGRAGYARGSSALVRPRLRRLVRGLVAPLSQRMRRGEGGLLVVNASLALAYHPLREGLGLALVSLLCLLSLYLFNDVVDARDDQHNPKKDHLLAYTYVRDRSLFLTLWLLVSGLAVVAGAALGARAGAWVFIVSLVNVAYSLLCKKVPIVDIVWVGLWGSAYASIVTDRTAWIVMVAAMTSICHIYQISEDRAADAASGIATSATLRASLLALLQAGTVGVLMAGAWALSGSVAALTLAGLFAYWLVWHGQPRTGWVLAKVHFSLVWAYLLAGG